MIDPSYIDKDEIDDDIGNNNNDNINKDDNVNKSQKEKKIEKEEKKENNEGKTLKLEPGKVKEGKQKKKCC